MCVINLAVKWIKEGIILLRSVSEDIDDFFSKQVTMEFLIETKKTGTYREEVLNTGEQ